MANKKNVHEEIVRPGKKVLIDWVYEQGGQAQAAQIIGVRAETLNRWINKVMKPRGLSRRRLLELGVEV